MNIKTIKSTFSWSLEYVLIVATIMECNSLLLVEVCTESKLDMQSVFAKVIIATAAILLALKLTNRNTIKVYLEKFFPVLVVMEVYAVIYYLLGVRPSQDSFIKKDFIKKFLLMLPMYSSLLFIERKEEKSGNDRLIYKYSNVVCIIAFLNLIVYYMSTFHVNELESEVVYLHWYNGGELSGLVNCLNVCYLLPGMMAQSFNIHFLRDFGPFVEPLMFLIPLGMALFVELFLRGKDDKWCFWRCLLLSATIFTVQSTYGLMMLVIAWGVKLMSLCNAKERLISIIPTTVVIIAGCGYFVAYKVRSFDVSLIVDRLMENKHFTDYVYPLKAFLSKPLLAGGYLNNDLTISFFSEEALKDIGFSNSIAVVLGQGGIVLGLLCMLPFLIGVLQLFSINNRKYALFMLGPLYLYTVTIFHYRYFLIFIFALGYSLLEVEKNDEKRKAISLRVIQKDDIYGCADTGKTFLQNIKAFVLGSLWKKPLIIAISALLIIACGTGIWNLFFKLLFFYQLTSGQSGIRVLYGVISLIALLTWCRVMSREMVAKKQIIVGLLYFAVTQIVYVLSYGMIYEYVDTAIQLWFGERELIRETIVLMCFLAYLVVSRIVYIEAYKAAVKKDAKKLTIPVGLTALIWLFLVIVNIEFTHKLDSNVSLIEAQIEPLKKVIEVKTGKLYTDELPVLYNLVLKDVEYGAIRGEGYRVLEKATILEPKDKELSVLFNVGYQAAQISEDHIIYSNDESVISGMEKYGYKFYRYYIFDGDIDLEEAARLNGLNIIEDDGEKALLVEGEKKSLIYGPYDTLQPGTYTVIFSLKINLKEYSNIPDDTVIASVRTSHKYGKSINQQFEVKKRDFDDSGCMNVESIITVGSVEDGYEYLVIGIDDYAVEIQKIIIRRSPKLITHVKYNVHQMPIFEAYYDEEGKTTYTSQNYAAVEKQYNSADIVTCLKYLDEKGEPSNITEGYAEVRYDYNDKLQLIKLSYYDENGNPTNKTNGCAEVRYGYNEKKQLIDEAYFDEKGEPAALPSGIFRTQFGYDEFGYINDYRYCDPDGKLMNQTNGVARAHFTLDDKHRWTRVDYYDSEGEKVLFDSGYSSEEREFNEAGLESVHRYLDINGETVALTYGVAEVHYFYNDDDQLVRLEFYGTDGTRVMNLFGVSAVVYKKDLADNLLNEKYYDTFDNPVANTTGISEIEREYNARNLVVSETYYDVSGNETLSPSGFSRVEYEYDAEGNTIKTTKYDTSGKVVEEN